MFRSSTPFLSPVDSETQSLIQSLQGGDSSALDAATPTYEEEDEETPDILAEGASAEGGSSEEAGSNPEESSQNLDPAAKKGSSPDVEELVVTDETGKTKIKIDWNNKDAIRNTLKLAAGARKWQAERDQAKASLSKLTEESEDIRASWEAVEGAFKQRGIAGLAELMAGSPEAYQSWIKSQVDRELYKRDASPAELERLEMAERMERAELSARQLQEQTERQRQAAEQEAQRAQVAKVEGAIHPAFEQFRFNGELGNPVLEAKLDKAIWTAALDELAEVEEKQGAAAITPQLAKKVFKEHAEEIKKAFQVQARKEAATATEVRKTQAQVKVAAKAQTLADSNRAEAGGFLSDLNNNNWGAALKKLALKK